MGLEVGKAPFGWYKKFVISCKGHPLSELSRNITSVEEDDKVGGDTTALEAEKKVKSEWLILTPDGKIVPWNFKRKPMREI